MTLPGKRGTLKGEGGTSDLDISQPDRQTELGDWDETRYLR